MNQSVAPLQSFTSPGDDMILELAFAARCRYIVTHNVRHFAPAQALGIEPVTRGEFWKILQKESHP